MDLTQLDQLKDQLVHESNFQKTIQFARITCKGLPKGFELRN